VLTVLHATHPNQGRPKITTNQIGGKEKFKVRLRNIPRIMALRICMLNLSISTTNISRMLVFRKDILQISHSF
jgi:hypothetical protein